MTLRVAYLLLLNSTVMESAVRSHYIKPLWITPKPCTQKQASLPSYFFLPPICSPLPPPLPPAVLGQPWAGHRAYSCQKHQTGFITNEPAWTLFLSFRCLPEYSKIAFIRNCRYRRVILSLKIFMRLLVFKSPSCSDQKVIKIVRR